MEKASVAILVMGAWPEKDENGRWFFPSFDRPEDTGGGLRAPAAVLLSKEFPGAVLIASGGKGKFRNIPDAPACAEIIASGLAAAGIKKEDIIIEDKSNNTFEELLFLQDLDDKYHWRKIFIISNEYHLPRIRAMLENHPRLKSFWTSGNAQLRSAEEILLKASPDAWTKKINAAYSGPAMAQRKVLENRGVGQIKDGTYDYKPTVI